MTTSHQAGDVVRVSGPQGIIGSIPYLLGFHPQESLVMLCLRGERNRMGPVLRIDLPTGRAARRSQLADYLAIQADQHADSVVLVCYTEASDTAVRGRRAFAHAPLIKDCIKKIQRAGVFVFDAALVRDDTCVSYLQHTPGEPGFPLLEAGDDENLARLSSNHAGAGRAVLPDRETLRHSIAGPTGPREAAAARAITAARAAIVSRDNDAHSLDALLAALAEEHELIRHRGVITDGPAATVVAALHIPGLRDEAIFWALHHLDDAIVPLFIGLATWTPDLDCAQICAVLAVVAYRQGDGALAQCALDRVLAVDPGHRLSGLLLAMMQAGMPPHLLDAMLSDDPQAGSYYSDGEDHSDSEEMAEFDYFGPDMDCQGMETDDRDSDDNWL